MRFLSVCSGEADVEITQLKRHLVCLKVVSIPRPGQLLTGADDGLCSSQDPSVHDLAHQEAVRLEKWRRLRVQSTRCLQAWRQGFKLSPRYSTDPHDVDVIRLQRILEDVFLKVFSIPASTLIAHFCFISKPVIIQMHVCHHYPLVLYSERSHGS